VLDVDDLPPDLAPVTHQPSSVSLNAGMTIRDAERQLIQSTLQAAEGNRTEAAKMLGIGERTLYRKIKEYELG
jgi:two-component system response regulator HydG